LVQAPILGLIRRDLESVGQATVGGREEPLGTLCAP
jgi:hypothetical protein